MTAPTTEALFDKLEPLFYKHAARFNNNRDTTEVRAQIDALIAIKPHCWPADPVTGPNYEAGIWSRRNYEAMVEDQVGEPNVPVELARAVEGPRAAGAVALVYAGNVAGQCRATASSPIAHNVMVDGGSGSLSELLNDAAHTIEALARAAREGVRLIEGNELVSKTTQAYNWAAKARAAIAGQGDDWEPIETAPDDELVVVFYLQKDGDEEVDMHTLDYKEDGSWYYHGEHFEHYMAVGGPNAAGPDVVCTGPAETAPYTHWKRLGSPAVFGNGRTGL